MTCCTGRRFFPPLALLFFSLLFFMQAAMGRTLEKRTCSPWPSRWLFFCLHLRSDENHIRRVEAVADV